jgi:hypothetical protein
MKARSTTFGRPLLVEKGNQRLADAEFGDRRLGVEARIGAQVWAAAFTAFWSRGVKARSACWTRLPS